VDGFGKLANLDTGPDPLPGLVVVLGPNEAGKSTLFAFLTTIFYGFQPATRESNPHTPWGASEAAGRVRIRLADGLSAEVERKLRSQPTGRLSLGGAGRELRNQALPWVEHVPRAVFRQVFAVTLEELAGLEPETWARIQDKVVGSMGATDLRSARVVADALEAEAGEIWRPNRRGNQRLRSLQGDIRALRSRRIAAHERDMKLRAIGREREALEERFTEVRAERHRLRDLVDRLQTLLPLERQLDRIGALRAEGGDRSVLQGLPEDPLERLAALEAERTAACSQLSSLDAELADCNATLHAFDDRARSILGRRAEITQAGARSAACAADRTAARVLEQEIASVEARLDAVSGPLLSGSWREQQEELARVPVAVLEDRLARAAETPSRPGGARLVGVAIAVVVLVGVALLAWGVAAGRQLPTALGAAVAAVSLAVGAAETFRGRAGRDRAPLRPDRDSPSLLAEIRLQPAWRGERTPALLSELARLQGLLAERAGRVQAAATARARFEEADAAAGRLARELGLATGGGAEAVCAALETALRDAEEKRQAADHAARESRRLGGEKEAVSVRLSRLAGSITALERTGAALAPGDGRRGLEMARVRILAHQRADRLEEEIERAHPDRKDLETQIRAARERERSRPHERTDLASLKARLEKLEDETHELVRRTEAMDAEARKLREMETVDAVDSEIAALREAEERLGRERDRKLIVARILREADRRFREEHQPDLLRRAGSYLGRLTGGRYERLVVDETDGAAPFRLVGPGLPAPVPLAAPVSTGTLEQAYFSLRLAIVDHLDQGGERLPLFVDEVLVNWDAERRARGVEVLASIAASRQIFVFTCHPDVAGELVERGGRILALDRGD
jgi:uncharacterized protein YhaN